MVNQNLSNTKIELVSFLYANGARSLDEIAAALELTEDKVFNAAVKFPELFKLHPMPSGKTVFVQLRLENTAVGSIVKEELEKLKLAKKQ